MNMRVTALTALVLAASSAAYAGDPLVWDNGDVYVDPETSMVWVFLNLVMTGNGFDTAIADDFMLAQDTFITSVQWSGTEWKGGIPNAFVIEFYASDPSGTTPTHGIDDPSKTALASYFIEIGDIDITALDLWPTDPEPHMQLDANLPTPFIAEGNNLYWISIQAYFDDYGNFGWLQSENSQLNVIAAATDGMWETYQFGEDEYAGDMAFKLYGTPVPGPGAVAVLGVAMIVSRRRRR